MRESGRERVGKRRESGGRGAEGWREGWGVGGGAGNIGGGAGRRWGEENEHTYVDW